MTERTWAFVVRIWQEDGSPSDSMSSESELIRGSVQYVSTGDLHYFSNLAQLMQLLAEQIHLEICNESAGSFGMDEDGD